MSYSLRQDAPDDEEAALNAEPAVQGSSPAVESTATGADGRRRSSAATLVILLLGQGMASFDSSITAVAGPSIERSLHANGALLQLVVAGYALTFAIFVITGARLGADYGYRRVFLTGLATFTLTSLLCGIAPTIWALAVLRLLQGVSGAIMLPQVLSSIQSLYDGPLRDRAVSWYSAVLSVGVVSGQIIGGLLVNANVFGLGWRVVFLINVPIGVALLVMSRRHLSVTGGGERQHFDAAGVGLLGAGIALVVVPLLFGRQQGWPWWVWPSFAGSAAVLGIFTLVELRRRERSPVLDLTVLTTPGVARGLGAASIVMGGYAGLLFCLTVHLQVGLGYSAARAGLSFAPYAVGFAVSSLITPKLPQSVKTRLPVAGPALFAVSASVLLLLAADDWPPAASVPLLFFSGAGQAAAFGPTVARAVARLLPRQAAAASGLITTGSVLAQALGVTVLGDLYLAHAGHTSQTARAALLPVGAVLVLLLAGAAVMGRLPARRAP